MGHEILKRGEKTGGDGEFTPIRLLGFRTGVAHFRGAGADEYSMLRYVVNNWASGAIPFPLEVDDGHTGVFLWVFWFILTANIVQESPGCVAINPSQSDPFLLPDNLYLQSKGEIGVSYASCPNFPGLIRT